MSVRWGGGILRREDYDYEEARATVEVRGDLVFEEYNAAAEMAKELRKVYGYTVIEEGDAAELDRLIRETGSQMLIGFWEEIYGEV